MKIIFTVLCAIALFAAPSKSFAVRAALGPAEAGPPYNNGGTMCNTMVQEFVNYHIEYGGGGGHYVVDSYEVETTVDCGGISIDNTTTNFTTDPATGLLTGLTWTGCTDNHNGSGCSWANSSTFISYVINAINSHPFHP